MPTAKRTMTRSDDAKYEVDEGGAIREPDAAAANADREENHDPERRRKI